MCPAVSLCLWVARLTHLHHGRTNSVPAFCCGSVLSQRNKLDREQERHRHTTIVAKLFLLEQKFQRMMSNYEPVKQAVDETAGDVWESLKLVAGELKDGFHRIRNSL